MMPFEGGPDSLANATFIFSCIAALLYGVVVVNPSHSLLISIVKALAVGLLALLAILQGGHWLLVLALAFSAGGDFFLSREGQGPFIAGLTRFLMAHFSYIALFLISGGGLAAIASSPLRVGLALVLIAFGIAMYARLRRAVGPRMRLPIAAYGIALIGMAISSLTLGAPIVVVGALLFVLSDSLLSTEQFLLPATSPHRNWMSRVIWGTYYVGQVLITLGLIRF